MATSFQTIEFAPRFVVGDGKISAGQTRFFVLALPGCFGAPGGENAVVELSENSAQHGGERRDRHEFRDDI